MARRRSLGHKIVPIDGGPIDRDVALIHVHAARGDRSDDLWHPFYRPERIVGLRHLVSQTLKNSTI